MPDSRTALTGAERKSRYDRRERLGLINFRGDMPPEIGEWLIREGVMDDDGSTDPEDWGAALVEMAKMMMAAKLP